MTSKSDALTFWLQLETLPAVIQDQECIISYNIPEYQLSHNATFTLTGLQDSLTIHQLLIYRYPMKLSNIG